MERSTIKYLAEFLAKLDDGYGESIDVNRFCMDADEKKLDITDDLSWCKDFERTVGFIQRIFSKPHLHVKYVKEVIKVQTANRIDAEGFALTMREPKLWEDSEDGPRPKSVYMTLFEDEYAIYENRFIKMLVDEMIRYLMDTLKELSVSLGSLRVYFGSRLTTASALHIGEEEGEEASSVAQDEKRILVEGNDPIVETYNTVERLLKKLRSLKNSFLYKVCHGKPIPGTIQPTNILTKDYSYRECFLFYRRLSVMHGRGKDIGAALLDNGVLRLMYALYSNGYRVVGKPFYSRPLMGDHSCEGVRFRKRKFTVEMRTLNDKEIELTTMMSQKAGEDMLYFEEREEQRHTSKVILKIDKCSAEESKDIAKRYRAEKLAEGYDEAYLVVYSKLPTDGIGVLNFANKGDMASRAAEDLIRSLTMQLAGAHKIFDKRCPVCGARIFASEDTTLSCPTCSSTWSLVKDDEVEKVWLRRVKQS